MSSRGQTEANRQNAYQSTGPRTAEGKAAVAHNALKHGLFTAQTVLKWEKQDDFELLRDQMLAELAPVGVMETLLAERLVSLAWRLKRAERMQNEATDEELERNDGMVVADLSSMPPLHVYKPPSSYEKQRSLGQVTLLDFANARALERMFLYERRIESSLYRAMAQLRQLKQIRWFEQLEAQRCVQAQKEADLKKQSQSVGPADGTAPLPRPLSDYLQTAYGTNPPQWVQARLGQASWPFKGGNGSKRVSARKTQSPVGKTPFPLSLPNL